MFKNAIVRKPGKNFSEGLTTSDLGRPDYHKILRQHVCYIETLRCLGLDVIVLPELEEFPDAYFVEDTAVVFDEAAVITNPGADERKGEEISIVKVLESYKPIEKIIFPGTVDGGDVLQISKVFYIGISERTNEEGAKQFKKIVAKYGYTTVSIPVGKGLHLKSSINYVGKNTVLLTENFKNQHEFGDYEKIILTHEDEYAANTLLINDTLITPDGFPETEEKLQSLGMNIIKLDVSEVQKMDGGLTCMSLRF